MRGQGGISKRRDVVAEVVGRGWKFGKASDKRPVEDNEHRQAREASETTIFSDTGGSDKYSTSAIPECSPLLSRKAVL